MASRIMMQADGTKRPLAFAEGGQETLLISSASTTWAGVPFEVHRTIPGETRESGPLEGEHGLVVFLAGWSEITVCTKAGELTHRAVPGSTAFMSGDEPASSRVKGSAEVAAVHLPPEWLRRVDLSEAPAGFGRLPALAGDQTARMLVSAMRAEVSRGARAGRLYAESLSVALLSYVLDALPPSPMKVQGVLSEEQRRRLAGHIRDRLGEDLALTDLAALVGLSTRQFSRRFREAFGVPPHRYVLERRLEEGALRLAVGTHDIAEIAHTLGFSSQSHFGAAFRKRFGQTPRQYAIERRRSRRVRS